MGALLFLASSAWSGEAGAVRLRVRGGTLIELRAFQRADAYVVRGVVSDDVGATLGRVSVRLGAPDARLGPPLPCVGAEAAGTARAEGSGWSVVTDERGQFCVRASGLGPGRVDAEFVGNNLFEGARADTRPLPESEQRAATSIRFESVPATIDLERPSYPVSIALRVDRADAQRLFLQGHARREGLTVVLSDERGEELGRASTGGDGRARFELPSAALAGPGDGELRADFAGDPQLAASRAKVFVSRTAVATLTVPEEPAPGDPSSGIPVEVRVQTSRGPVDGGVVEAVAGAESVGSAPVVEGRAALVVSFETAATGALPVTLRYVPASPHFIAGPSIEAMIAVRGPSPVRQVVLVLAGFGLAAWIVAKWRRAPKQRSEPSAEGPPPSGRPEVLVLERPSGLRGWRGVVRDAHDDTPIEAELTIIVPSFQGDQVITRTRSDATGNFQLEGDAPRDARLVIEATYHATHEQLLPAPSVLRVALVSRRRALLESLVGWARRRGAPFDASKEPTPGHVRRVAARSGAAEVAAWAGKLERAAYGPDPVTRELESEVAAEEPGRVRPGVVDEAPRVSAGASPR